jgi:hypothetical protein
VRDDDTDIDALLDATLGKIGGESQKYLADTAKLQTMLDAAAGAPKKLVDPRTLPVRFHRLKQFALSAAHYLDSCQGEVNESLALRMGAGVHAGLFEDRPLVCYDGRRAGKAWLKFEKRHKERGAVILNAREYEVAMGVVDAVRRHKRAMKLLFDGTTRELTFDWTYCDRACRATPDAHVPGVRNSDLKSTRTAEPRRFARDALQRAYHAQLAYYSEALAAHLGKRPVEDYLVAVENVRPHNVVVWRMPERTMAVGAMLVNQWFEQLLVAESSNYYGGYVEHDLELDLPEYMDAEGPLTLEVNGELVVVD